MLLDCLGEDPAGWKLELISDLDGDVLDVRDDRKQVSLESFFQKLPKEQRAAIEVVAMDMHRPYINAVAADAARVERPYGWNTIARPRVDAAGTWASGGFSTNHCA